MPKSLGRCCRQQFDLQLDAIPSRSDCAPIITTSGAAPDAGFPGPTWQNCRVFVINLRLTDILQNHFDWRFCGKDVVFYRVYGTQNTINSSRFAGTGRSA